MSTFLVGAALGWARRRATRPFTAEEAGGHSFRRGCAASLQHVGASDATSRAVGIWGSNSMHGYMDVTCGGAMERAMLAMAEVDARVRPAASGRGID